MTPEQAAQAVAAARQQAQASARRDFSQLQAQALQAGQTRAERLFPAGRRPAPQTALLNARGSRILRGWYTEVYTAALRDRLGERVRVPAAAEVDAAATNLRQSLGSREPDVPLRMAGSLHRRALTDAAATGTSLQAALTGAAQRRGAAHVARQPPTDEARTAILEHWYQRCYLATVNAQLGLLQPLQTVTAAEAREVAASVEHGQARQLIGPDNIALVTAHGTAMTDIDRRLAGGATGVVEPPAVKVSNTVLRAQIVGTWTALGAATPEDRHNRRVEWATAAGVPATAATQSWKQLPGPQQSQLIAYWLDTHHAQGPKLVAGRPPADLPFIGAQRLSPAPRKPRRPRCSTTRSGRPQHKR